MGRCYPYSPSDSSIRKLLIPREHGSWALWIMPMISASIVVYASGPSRDRSLASLLLLSIAFGLVLAAAYLNPLP